MSEVESIIGNPISRKEAEETTISKYVIIRLVQLIVSTYYVNSEGVWINL
jgi:hypothetical protein